MEQPQDAVRADWAMQAGEEAWMWSSIQSLEGIWDCFEQYKVIYHAKMHRAEKVSYHYNARTALQHGKNTFPVLWILSAFHNTPDSHIKWN